MYVWLAWLVTLAPVQTLDLEDPLVVVLGVVMLVVVVLMVVVVVVRELTYFYFRVSPIHLQHTSPPG